MAPPWTRRSGEYPVSALCPLCSRARVDHPSAICFNRGGPERPPGVHRRAWLTAGHGALAGGAVQRRVITQSYRHRQICVERLELDHTVCVCNWSIATRGLGPPRRVSAGPHHMVHHANQQPPHVCGVSVVVNPQSKPRTFCRIAPPFSMN